MGWIYSQKFWLILISVENIQIGYFWSQIKKIDKYLTSSGFKK